jgi:D-proline reductase (dithiol) PrdB
LIEIPLAYPYKPLHECRLALITTGGVHLPEDARFDIDDPSGDYSYREIPREAGDLTWSHAYYATNRGDTDLDSVFPLWTMRELVAEGVVGELGPRHFSFMGGIHEPAPLVRETAPEVAQKLADDGVDVVLLTPS